MVGGWLFVRCGAVRSGASRCGAARCRLDFRLAWIATVILGLKAAPLPPRFPYRQYPNAFAPQLAVEPLGPNIRIVVKTVATGALVVGGGWWLVVGCLCGAVRCAPVRRSAVRCGAGLTSD